ncbi:MAG: hypothetical protein R2705_24640 [Ilumatobacteraceae bacterium]
MMNSQDALRRTWTPSFRALGFPITIRPGFFLFVLLALVAYRGPLGPWLAGSLALFTITHELGHATMAKLYGARAEIALDMFAGYTSYEPSRAMTARERAIIAVAGPAAEIVPGLIALAALGVNPFDRQAVQQSDAALAIWWAGPVLGLVNLLPLVPLDGGVVVATVLDAIAPGRGRRLATRVSMAITVLATIALLTRADLRPIALFTGALFGFQVMQLRASAMPGTGSPRRTVRADGDQRPADRRGARQGGPHSTARGAVLQGWPRRRGVARRPAAAARRTDHGDGLVVAAIAADEPDEIVDALEHDGDFAVIRDHAAFGALHLVLTS